MVEDDVRNILYVYKHFKAKPGDSLISNHFLGVARFRHWNANELQAGVEEAHRLGLVERAERGWRLTQAGFEQASKIELAAAG